MMTLNIFLFELKYRLKRPATYLYFFLVLIVALILVSTGSTPATEKEFHNSPLNIAELQLLISLFGILIASAIMGVPLYRDIEHKTGTFLFSYPISKTSYFMGRFWGSFTILILVSWGVIIGFYLGSLLGPVFGEPAERYGPNVFYHYIQPWYSLILPNLWFSATLFFALIIFTKNIRSIYSGGIVFFILYLLSNFLAQDIENKELVQLLDPFGLNSFNYQSRYLTSFEKNNFVLEVSSYLLYNRLLWTGVGLVVFLASFFRFDFTYFFNQKIKKAKKQEDKQETFSGKLEKISTSFSRKYQWNSLRILSKLEAKNILKDGYFRAILLGGVIFLVIQFWIGNTIYSVPNQPSTSFLMEYKGYDYIIFVFIIIVFFTGEALHRDKSSGYAQISDTFPITNGVSIASKFFGMVLICLLLATIPVVVGPIIQILKGYYQFNWSTYFIDSYLITFPDYLQMSMLIFAVHLFVNNKFGGHAVSIALWLAMIVLRTFADFNFNLFFFSYKPGYLWSDMNGLGHFGAPLLWYNLYWTLFGLFLILFFSITYSRGAESNIKTRLSNAKERLLKPYALVAYSSLVITIIIGSFIFKNVVYTNNYLTPKESLNRSAAYEKQLKKYELIPQPKVVDIKLTADVFPKDRDVYFSGDVTLVNKTDSPINSLHLADASLSYFHAIYKGDTLDYRFPLVYDKPSFQWFGSKEEKPWYKIYKLPKTLNPNDTIELKMVSAIINQGFVNSGYGREVVYNGTFIGGGLPSIGYDRSFELQSDEERKKRDLPINEYELPPHNDPYGVSTLLFNDDADLITYEAIVSTSKDQIAISPGYLIKEWEEGDRKYFHYKQDSKIDLFFNIVSADYEVTSAKVNINDSTEIDLQIFHHETHDYNLDRFMNAFKDGLQYFSDSYGPFQYRQMRLLEFPRYASFAQSFPNTVPYAESFGWIGDFSDPNDFDYGYFVTAHELAHQWWGHQVVPNYTRGSNLISESLAEYTALVLTERKYGKDNMKRFLKQELDNYLSGRSNENKKENLYINCNRSYQWYYKGSLILYGLRDFIGDSTMNKAIRNFRDEFALKEEPPFAGSNDLYRHFEAVVPDSLKYYLEDTWKKLTLYENKVDEAIAKKSGDKYEVTLTVNTQKLYADSLGMETKAEYDGDYIDIGVFASDTTNEEGRKITRPLHIEKFKLKPGEHTITLMVDKQPNKAGIDPYNKLIDRRPDDNIKSVDLED